jgi:hypothetical protein
MSAISFLTKVISIIAFLLLCGVIYFFFLPYYTPSTSETAVPETALNPNYAEAEKIYLQGTLTEAKALEAKALYESALGNVASVEEEAAIKYRIAILETTDNPTRSIGLYKEIIADESISTLRRAYSAQRLAMLFSTNSSSSLSLVLFSGDPYSSFISGADTTLALRRLDEYAISIYPLALSSLRSALWYVNTLIDLKRAGLTEELEAKKSEYLPLIEERLTNAEQDIERTRLDSKDAATLIPDALHYKALIYARLSALGYDYDYDEAMKFALGASLATNNTINTASVKFGYGAHLLIYETGREQEAFALMEEVVNNLNAYPSFKRSWTAEKNNVLGRKNYYIDIAERWPKYKETLLSLGWTEEDFK